MTKVGLKKHLHECLQKEVMMNDKPFSWLSAAHKAFKCPERRLNFWWRIASYKYHCGGKLNRSLAFKINRKLIRKYNAEIQLPAIIGPGLNITHFMSVAINGCSVIGKNFKIRHNCTIGLGGSLNNNNPNPIIRIGDNVEMGTGSCIMGNDLTIGNNVSIGAMSFINKDVPNDHVVYNERRMIIKHKTQPTS